MTSCQALTNAYQFVITAILYALMNFGPQPVYIDWQEEQPFNAITEYRHYFEHKKEYQEREYLIQHFDLGLYLYQAALDAVQRHRGELIRWTISGSIMGDMENIAREQNLDIYHTKAAIRLWLIFSDKKE